MLWLYIILGIVGYLYTGRLFIRYVSVYLPDNSNNEFTKDPELAAVGILIWPALFLICIVYLIGKILMLISGVPKAGGDN